MTKKILLEFVFRGKEITLFTDNTFRILEWLGTPQGEEENILVNKCQVEGILKEVGK